MVLVSLAVEGRMLQEEADSTEIFGLREYRLQIKPCRTIASLSNRIFSNTGAVVRSLRVESR